MTIEELTDYIINHDLELQIISGDRQAILDRLALDEVWPVSDYEVGEAIELARQDPYIQRIAEKFGGDG